MTRHTANTRYRLARFDVHRLDSPSKPVNKEVAGSIQRRYRPDVVNTDVASEQSRTACSRVYSSKLELNHRQGVLGYEEYFPSRRRPYVPGERTRRRSSIEMHPVLLAQIGDD